MYNKKNEIIDEYFGKMAHKKMEKLFLTDDEINDQINKGILIKDILKPQYNIVSSSNREVLYGTWFSIGIKHIFNYYYSSSDTICLTDFHFVIVEKKLVTAGNQAFNVNIIPLEKIKSIQLIERSEYVKANSYEVKKDPVKGAIVGSAIAGTTGAIIGATINSGTKTVVNDSGMMYYRDINVEFEDGNSYKWENIDSSLKSSHKSTYGIDYENENISFLIKRAKENLSDIDKKEIVLKSISKKRCYVATCVYGSYDCPKVWVLRRFRDYYLDNSILGRLFIKIYYAISPSIVKVFGESKLFKNFNKKILDYFVEFLKVNGYQDTEYKDKY